MSTESSRSDIIDTYIGNCRSTRAVLVPVCFGLLHSCHNTQSDSKYLLVVLWLKVASLYSLDIREPLKYLMFELRHRNLWVIVKILLLSRSKAGNM